MGIPVGYTQGANGFLYKTADNTGPYVQDASGAAVLMGSAGDIAAASTDSGNPVKMGGVYNATLPTLTDGQRGNIQLGSRGGLNVNILSANSNSAVQGASMNSDTVSVTSVGLYVLAFENLMNGATWSRKSFATAASRIVSSAATNNATVAKASAGQLKSIIGYNSNAAVRYLKLYNKATAPTVGTDTPVLTIPLAPSKDFNILFGDGFWFTTGIGYGLVTGSADSDNTAVGAGDILGLNLCYA